MLRRNRTTQLRIEALESRAMMAGNVTAAVVGGNLLIRGDNQFNDIAITAGPNPGDFLITGNNGTTVNGSSAPITESGVTRNVMIAFKKAGCTLKIGDSQDQTLSIPGQLAIGAGSGNNTIDLENLQIGGNLNVGLGNGQNTLTVDSVTARAALIGAGSGGDTVTISNTTVTKEFLVGTGNGSDTVTITGPGADAVMARSLSVLTGGGSDVVNLADVDIRRGLLVNLGRGDDTLNLNGGNTVGGMAVLLGGPGDDDLAVNAAPNSFHNMAIVGFETQDPIA
jgi:hypothetical protein